MDGFLQVHSSSDLPSSPSNSFIADEVASICPLITPSPPTNDLINPLPESTESSFVIGDELVTMLKHVQDQGKGEGGDSASSSSSALAEPACTQLLHRNNYHHITKDEPNEETNGKVQPLQLTFRNPPENYFFMSWNWPLIRKVSLWLFLSGLIAMLALVIAMISTLPRTCNPQTEWYQGSVIYEIFPGSFYDSNKDTIGDFKGILRKSKYLTSLNIKAIRLNSIFKTQGSYPEHYREPISLTEIAPSLGDINDFDLLIRHLHLKNISVILDLPIHPVVKQFGNGKTFIDISNNSTNIEPSVEFLKTSTSNDPVEEALFYWVKHEIDGFYLKGLDHFVHEPNFIQSLRRWKKIAGPNRPLIVNESVIEIAETKLSKTVQNIILNNIDLVDVRLEIEKGESQVSKQLERKQNGTLFSRPGAPWILWSLSDETTRRLANILPYGNATLGATLLQLMLPGTPSIFYGNEIGLKEILDPNREREDSRHLHHLTAMAWPNKSQEILYWNHGEKTYANFDQVELISKMIALRKESPSIYINSVYKEGDNRANAEVKYSRGDLLVIQRWYPRRKSFVVASNLGNNKISADLSTLLYSGEVKIGPQVDSKPGTVSFKDISLWPGESVVISLD